MADEFSIKELSEQLQRELAKADNDFVMLQSTGPVASVDATATAPFLRVTEMSVELSLNKVEPNLIARLYHDVLRWIGRRLGSQPSRAAEQRYRLAPAGQADVGVRIRFTRDTSGNYVASSDTT